MPFLDAVNSKLQVRQRSISIAVIFGVSQFFGCTQPLTRTNSVQEPGDSQRHDVLKPAIGSPKVSEELFSVTNRLFEERQRLDERRLQLAGRVDAAVATFRTAVREDYRSLLDGDEQGLALYLGRPELDKAVSIAALEVARYARLVRMVEERIETLKHATLEAESWQRYSSDVEQLGVTPASEWPVLKAKAIAEQQLHLPADTSFAEIPLYEVADEIMPLLRRERNAILQEEEEVRHEQLRLQQAEAERSRQLEIARQKKLQEQRRQEEEQRIHEEANRKAVIEAARRQAEEQTQREQLELRAQQEARALMLYGEACHAYFDGRYQATVVSLDQAIELNDRDPRAYYYRGLAKYQLGQSEGALLDFRRGSELERGGAFGVGAALERVQGPVRLALENVRAGRPPR